MKIVHVYAKNIDMFVEAVKGTDIKLNASRDSDYLISSLQNYNARDVLGLIVFANPMTKKTLQLIQKFDRLYMFKPMPVIVINDVATELKQKGYFKLRHSKLFLLDSEDNSLSDVELAEIFTTLVAFSGEIYDLSVIPAEARRNVKVENTTQTRLAMSEQLSSLLGLVGRETYHADSGESKWGS